MRTVAKISVSRTPVWKVVTLSGFLFGFYFAEMLRSTPRARNGSSFFVLKTKSGEEGGDLVCEKMGESISSRLFKNVMVLSEVGP